MINLLSKKDKRYLTILETLYYNGRSTLKELVQATNSSRSTVQEDIPFINEFIKPMSIQTSIDGCTLSYPCNFSIDYVYACILTESLEYSLIEMVFFEGEERLEDYADKLFISLSTLKRMISRLNRQTRKLGFEIATGPIQLIGNENAICNTMIYYFSEKYANLEFPLDKVQLTAVDQLVQLILHEKKAFNNLADIEKLKLVIMVSLVRIQRGHHLITYDTSITDRLDSKIFNDFFIKKAFKTVFKIDLTKNNLARLLYPFINENFAFSYTDAIEIANGNPEKHQLLIKVDDYLNFVSQELEVPIQQKEAIALDIFNLDTLNFGPSYLLFDKKKHFIDSLRKDSPYIVNFLYDSAYNRYFKEKAQAYEIEQLLYILITHWKELTKKIYSFNPVFEVGIFMTSDVEHSHFVAEILTQHFEGQFCFHPILSDTHKEVNKQFKKYDFIVTNVSGLHEDDITFVCIGLYPSASDFQKIASLYPALNKAKQNNLKKLPIHQQG